MTAELLPRPNYNQPFVDKTGTLSAWAEVFVRQVYNRLGGAVDKVDAAATTAAAAVPQGTEVVAGGGLQVGGSLGGNVGVSLYVSVDALANLPTTGVQDGDWAYALDGRKPGEGAGAGTGVPVVWSNGHWYSACSGAVVTA
jgi:hypothetical protein